MDAPAFGATPVGGVSGALNNIGAVNRYFEI